MGIRKLTNIKTIYGLFEELDLFNLRNFEDFAAKFDPLTELQEVELIDILKSLLPKKPKEPPVKIPPPPLVVNGEQVEKIIDGDYYFIFNPNQLLNWTSPLITLPFSLGYYLTNYYSRFLEFMSDYFFIQDYENITDWDILYNLYYRDSNLIEYIQWDETNKDHYLQLKKDLLKVHHYCLSQAGERGSR